MLIVEKDSVFRKLVATAFPLLHNCILVTVSANCRQVNASQKASAWRPQLHAQPSEQLLYLPLISGQRHAIEGDAPLLTSVRRTVSKHPAVCTRRR
jgi:hypothetical protein